MPPKQNQSISYQKKPLKKKAIVLEDVPAVASPQDVAVKMVQRLIEVDHTGMTPPSILRSAVTPSVDSLSNITPDIKFEQRLKLFFAHYEPSQIPMIPQWLSNWKGREGEMLRQLIWYHGPEPPMFVPGCITEGYDGRSHTEREQLLGKARALMINFLTFYAPERLHMVDDVLGAWNGREDQLVFRLETQARDRDYILKYYNNAWPERMYEAVMVAREWVGLEGYLIKMFPCIPMGPPGIVLSADRPTQRTRRARSARHQVKQFFKVFKPEQLSEVDAILDAFEGREDVLLLSLRQQYLGDTDVTTMLDHSFLKPEMKAAFRTLCAHWNPEAAEELEELFWQFEGTEEEFVLMLCSLTPHAVSRAKTEVNKIVAAQQQSTSVSPPMSPTVSSSLSQYPHDNSSVLLMPPMTSNNQDLVTTPRLEKMQVEEEESKTKEEKRELIEDKTHDQLTSHVDSTIKKENVTCSNVPYPSLLFLPFTKPMTPEATLPSRLPAATESAANSITSTHFALSKVLASVDAEIALPALIREEIDATTLLTLTANELTSIGITDPALSRILSLKLKKQKVVKPDAPTVHSPQSSSSDKIPPKTTSSKTTLTTSKPTADSPQKMAPKSSVLLSSAASAPTPKTLKLASSSTLSLPTASSPQKLVPKFKSAVPTAATPPKINPKSHTKSSALASKMASKSISATN